MAREGETRERKMVRDIHILYADNIYLRVEPCIIDLAEMFRSENRSVLSKFNQPNVIDLFRIRTEIEYELYKQKVQNN